MAEVEQEVEPEVEQAGDGRPSPLERCRRCPKLALAAAACGVLVAAAVGAGAAMRRSAGSRPPTSPARGGGGPLVTQVGLVNIFSRPDVRRVRVGPTRRRPGGRSASGELARQGIRGRRSRSVPLP